MEKELTDNAHYADSFRITPRNAIRVDETGQFWQSTRHEMDARPIPDDAHCRRRYHRDMSLPVDKIICGDNVKTLKTFPDDCIDLVVTSPPYDNLRTYGGHSWDFEGVASELVRVLKPGGVIVWVVADATVDGSETGTSFRQALHFMEIGLRLHDTMIWNKGSFTAVGSVSCRYGPSTEYMFVISNGKPATFNPICDRKNIHAGTKPHGTVRQKNGATIKPTHERSAVGEFGIRFNVWVYQHSRMLTPPHSPKHSHATTSFHGATKAIPFWIRSAAPARRRRWRSTTGGTISGLKLTRSIARSQKSV